MKTLCFYTTANKAYYQFVVPFIASVFWSNPEAKVCLRVENRRPFEKMDLPGLGSRLFIEQYEKRFQAWGNQMAGAIRFVTAPPSWSNYTYIADIDILVLEDILEGHLTHMKVIDRCYSNIQRAGQMRMSGLHFVHTDTWYHQLRGETIEHYIDLVDKKMVTNDEKLLYYITKDQFGLPANGEPIKGIPVNWRPSHGIHVSPNRHIYGNPDWAITLSRAIAFSEMIKSEIWQIMEPFMAREYRAKLELIKNYIRKEHDILL